MRVHTELNILYGIGERQNVEEAIELEMTCVLYKTVKGCDHLEQVSSLCRHRVVQPLLPLGLYKSVTRTCNLLPKAKPYLLEGNRDFIENRN